jgi:CheY-like chemotaxis protein
MSGAHHNDPSAGPVLSRATASELNNLLQIISGTTALLQNIWEGSHNADNYFTMLRSSIERATEVTTELAIKAGASPLRSLLSPGITGPPRTGRGDTSADHILVTDDDPSTLGLFSDFLTRAGFMVTSARSGFECLDYFRSDPKSFDLILLDLSMPLMDGGEVFSRLRQVDPCVPVSLTTGYVAKEQLDQLLAAGLSGYLRKPCSGPELVAHVQSILGKPAEASASMTLPVAAAV